MRKLFVLLTMTVFLVVGGCATLDMKPVPPFYEVKSTLNTPQKVEAYLEEYGRSTQVGSHWCYTSARMASEALQLAGYDAYIFLIRYAGGRVGSHYVCVYKENGKWWTCGDVWILRCGNAGYKPVLRGFKRGPFKSLYVLAWDRSLGKLTSYSVSNKTSYKCYDSRGRLK